MHYLTGIRRFTGLRRAAGTLEFAHLPPRSLAPDTCMSACGLRLGLSFRKVVRMRVWTALGLRFPKENIRSSAAEDVTF